MDFVVVKENTVDRLVLTAWTLPGILSPKFFDWFGALLSEIEILTDYFVIDLDLLSDTNPILPFDLPPQSKFYKHFYDIQMSADAWLYLKYWDVIDFAYPLPELVEVPRPMRTGAIWVYEAEPYTEPQPFYGYEDQTKHPHPSDEGVELVSSKTTLGYDWELWRDWSYTSDMIFRGRVYLDALELHAMGGSMAWADSWGFVGGDRPYIGLNVPSPGKLNYYGSNPDNISPAFDALIRISSGSYHPPGYDYYMKYLPGGRGTRRTYVCPPPPPYPDGVVFLPFIHSIGNFVQINNLTTLPFGVRFV
jgi:hypothetical protein